MPTATKEHKEVMAERNIEIRDRLLKFWRENYEPKFKLFFRDRRKLYQYASLRQQTS
ncbi:hypothetical protein [Staphylococcus epidermidis]|uniref:hypothetical protein n=1 Tax=Staphylococcus epidermidis TaxID=1282 RepID=UPI00287FE2E3|nr:hypothetical protein [Staphylococcus epidermidis]